jgi:DNA topoisomerase VI subunit B
MTLAADTAPRKPAPRLERIAFRSSRLLEFCSEKELTLQTGHPALYWPTVVVKELVDNAIDACEEAGVAPTITLTVGVNFIEVTDNGPGLPEATLDGVLDYTSRTSSREAYVSPTRGAQGNALKTILAMPYALAGAEQRGRVEIETHGRRHVIEFAVDHIRQEPTIRRAVGPCDLLAGTRIRVHWPEPFRAIDKVRILEIADDFTWLNPHLTLEVHWFNGAAEENRVMARKATAPDWTKWLPSEPTSPHWYEPEHLQRLIGAYIKADEDAGRPRRTVREFVSEFRGLTGTAKQRAVLEATGLAMTPLAMLANADGTFNTGKVTTLLDAMKAHSRPVKSKLLGLIGEAHLRARFDAAGCAMASFKYTKMLAKDGLPSVVEIAFAARKDQALGRRLVTGVNWSPGVGNPFRQLGKQGESLDRYLADQRATSDEPVILFLHKACARVRYTDRGKSAVVTE